MATIVMLSATGAPGVTTTAVALTRAWPGSTGRSALMLEADRTGGDVVAGLLRGTVEIPVGVLALATLRESTSAGVWACAVGIPPDDDAPGSCGLLPGIPDEARAGALDLAWDVLGGVERELDGSGCDVLVDAGRVGATGLARPWIAGADLAVLLVEAGLPEVLAARRLAELWPDEAPDLAVLVREGGPTHAYRGSEVAAAVGRPLAGTLVEDARSAAVHSHGTGPGRRYHRSPYRRQLPGIAREMSGRAQARRSVVRSAP